MDWPNNKDGVLLSRLERGGVNFSKPHTIEFNVDFNHWPPAADAVSNLKERYEHIKIVEPGKTGDVQDGFISLKISEKVSYEFVAGTQQEITELMSQYGGYCNSWAIS